MKRWRQTRAPRLKPLPSSCCRALTYLKDGSQRFDQILVADYQTGKLVPVGKASFVPVAIGEISGEPRYGIGSTDYGPRSKLSNQVDRGRNS